MVQVLKEVEMASAEKPAALLYRRLSEIENIIELEQRAVAQHPDNFGIELSLKSSLREAERVRQELRDLISRGDS